MKLVNMNCPQCGAKLEIDAENKEASCQYCGTKLLINDEVTHIEYDNAEETGYKFEKGRQRAQDEISSKSSNASKKICQKCGGNDISFKREATEARGYYKTTAICNNCGNTWTVSTDLAQTLKKRRLWLWVLGWIFIFPIPLTILIHRNQKIDRKIRICVIAVVWIIYLIIGMIANKNSDAVDYATDSDINNSSEILTSDDNPASDESSSSVSYMDSSQTEESFSDDYADLDKFIDDFNAINDIKISSQDKIDIHDKSGGHYRTEFRLSAFDNAIAYHVTFDDGSGADLIDTANWSTGEIVNGSIARIYVLASTKENFESIFKSACLVMCPGTDISEIDNAIEKMTHPYKYEEMEYLYSSGSGLIGDANYTYSIKEKNSYFNFFLD